MVRLFSRISSLRSGHRRSHSVPDGREPSESSSQVVASNYPDTSNHGIQIEKFRPVERPTEPVTRDQPVGCPFPEPCIINDGRIWKERMSASVRARNDLSLIEEESDSVNKSGSRSHSGSTKHNMLSSYSHSAPECHIVNLLEECEASSRT